MVVVVVVEEWDRELRGSTNNGERERAKLLIERGEMMRVVIGDG